MRILGIDPGYGILGWSVIDKDLTLIDLGAIITSSDKSLDDRIFEIHKQLQTIIELHRPDCAAIEKLFFGKNTKTAMDVSKTIGAVLLTIRIAELQYFEYTPLQVKQALTGFGRASKTQVQIMLKRIFNLKEIPKVDDATDALAIAACHSFNNNIHFSQ